MSQQPPILRERPDAARARGVYTTLQELVALGRGRSPLKLDVRQRALAVLAGSHRSNFRGRGVDFNEVRIYNPGDDVRSIDWRVTARTGKPHTKVFREERERPVFLMVDQRQCMFFGSKQAFKSVTATRAAASIAWAARGRGDRLGAFLFNDTRTQELRPADGDRGVQRVLRALVQFNQQLEPESVIAPSSRKVVQSAMQGLAHVVRPGSLVFMFSDFSQMDDIAIQQLAVVRRHSDIVAVSISDPLERQLPAPGTYGFTDGRQSLLADTSDKKARKQYAMRHIETMAHLRRQLADLAIPVIELSTDDDIDTLLARALGSGHSHQRVPTP